MKHLELRPYQKSVLAKLKERLSSEDECVLAACPNSGKTEIMIQFMIDNPDKTFLILTHGTKVLKEQWKDRLGKYLSEQDFCDDFSKRITYGLPHFFYKKKLPKINNLIIDEAHEFAGEDLKMIASIKKQVL